MKKAIIIFGVGGAFLISGFQITAGAQAPAGVRSVRQGVYTERQAKRGEPLYKESCASCHGDDLAGSGPMPPLKGKMFQDIWKDQTVADLFQKTQTSMPASAPGSLTEQQTIDIIAYMFSVEKYPAGPTELEASMAPLMKITIEPPVR